MADIKWTTQQENAISHRGSSVIVSAAAGSGKTAVLVERVIRLVDLYDIDRLIIVTFTNAAAAQMREKIAKALIEKISSADSSDKAERYRKQLLYLPAASICTVHSFCLKLLRENFSRLGLSADFAIGDTAECSILLNQSLEEIINKKYEEQDPAFLKLASGFSSRNDSALVEMLLRIYNFSKGMAFPDEWFTVVKESYSKEKITDTREAEILLKEAIEKYSDILEELKAYPFADKLTSVINEDIAMFTDINFKDYDDVFLKINCKFKNFPIIKAAELEEIKEKVKRARDSFKADIAEISSGFMYSSIHLLEFAQMQKEDADTIIEFVKELDVAYSEKKRTKNIVDYSDLEHFALKLLVNDDKTPTDVASKLSESFDEIIVDEYQDTSPVQDIIFSNISRNMNNLFMVGDMKQSIYSFRNTAPEIFREKTESFGREDTKGRRIYLNNNFRSRKNILDFTNTVFSKIMNLKTGEVDYTKDEYLYYGASYDGNDPSVDIHILEQPSKDDELSKTEQEGYKIAEIIDSVVGKLDIYEDQKFRKARYKDIVILTRNSVNVSETLADCLTKCNIPTYNDDGKNSILSSYEAQVIISYLKIIDNPYQDIPLVSVLRSPIYNFSDNLLVKLRKCGDKKAKFFDLLNGYVTDDETEKLKIKIFLDDMNAFTEKAKSSSVASLIQAIIEKTYFEEYVSAMKGGMQRRSNLHFLVNTAKGFERAQFKGLFSFLIYLENFNGQNMQMSAPKILPSALDVVKINTIHKSKGLEYPIVIICGLGKSFASNDLSSSMLLHKKLGIGVKYTDDKNNVYYPSPIREAIKSKLNAETLSEEMRILYVALTRAKEKLILLGTVKKRDEYVDSYKTDARYLKEKLSPGLVKNAKSYLDFIMAGCSEEIFENSNPLITLSLKDIRPDGDDDTESGKDNENLPEISGSVREKLEYVYPSEGKSFYSKYSVSELKKLLTIDENSSDYFGFSSSLVKRKKDGISGAEEGSIIHLILEKTDERVINCEKDLEDAITGLVNENILTEDEAKCADTSSLYRYYTSSLCEKLKNSDEIYKEAPFNIIIDSSEIDSVNGGEKLQVQGVIDCYFRCGDEFYIVDYKTDTLTLQNRADRIALYTKQLEFYRKAVSKMHNTDKIRCFIYFTRYDDIIEL